MGDMFDYLAWRGDLPFDRDPVNAVDGLIFSGLAYVGLSEVVSENFLEPVTLAQAAEAFFSLPEERWRCRVKYDLKLLKAAAQTRRYGDVRLLYCREEFDPETPSQFAAVTALLPDGTAMLCFRGTDRTLVGWKEDFNMSFSETVPAQEKALRYTQAFAKVHDLPLRLCGHSKGGNLAVYAAAMCRPEEQSRILDVYNHDGPGFLSSLMGDPGYRAVVPKLHTFIPQSSIVGMLLEHEEPYTLIKSRQVGILQHDPYTWEILGRSFVTVEQIGEDSRFLDRTIRRWLADTTMAQRNDFVDAVFDLLAAGDADRTQQIMLPRNLLSYIKAWSADENLRKRITQEMGDFFRAAAEAAQQPDPDTPAIEGR